MSTNATPEQNNSGTTLDGPFTEPRTQGGATYYRCPGCGREVLAGDIEHLTHAPGCSADV